MIALRRFLSSVPLDTDGIAAEEIVARCKSRATIFLPA